MFSVNVGSFFVLLDAAVAGGILIVVPACGLRLYGKLMSTCMVAVFCPARSLLLKMS